MIQRLIDRIANAMPGRKTEVLSPGQPSVPTGTRVYAIGDVHGRADLLALAFAKIDHHETAMPIGNSIIVFLGDYVDRGFQSRAVLDMLIDQSQRRQIVAICGNHDEYMLRGLTDPDIAMKWLAAGGRETLFSYDVVALGNLNRDSVRSVMTQAVERIPTAHIAFLESLSLYATIGSYGFVHAGVRPGIALTEQSAVDLTSIRQPFLDYRGAHDYVIVHGHTPVSDPDFRSNRINIDTGAYITGKLTCLVLEDTQQYVL